MRTLTPKDTYDVEANEFAVFLAGDMKTPWRKELCDLLAEAKIPDLVILDPTVDDWETYVGEETFTNPKYITQVSWEHDSLSKANLRVFNFSGKSMAPITLVEMGTHMKSDDIIKLDDSYELHGYIEFIASKSNTPIVNTLQGLVSRIVIKATLKGFS